MNFTFRWKRSAARRFSSDKRGSVTVLLAFAAIAFALQLGLVVQEALLYRAQRALQSSTNLAALAAAQDIHCCATSTASTMAMSFSALNPVKGKTITMAAGYPLLKCLKSTGVPCSGPDNANAIVVKQQVEVPLPFGKFFGRPTKTLTAIATASAKGGYGRSLDVMLIVDTTASMNNSDTSCSIKGATRLTCAEAGARTLLQAFSPSQVQVGLMLFPGVTNSSQLPYEYDCSTGSTPAIASYKNAPVYQVVPLSTDYKTSSTAASLNTSSKLVRALGGGASGCTQGISAIGGYGTYYAGVIAAAQTALATNGRAGVQKVIIFLSDGDSNASSSNVPTGQATNQCQEGIAAAKSATAAGTWVYTAAYGAPTSGSCSTDSSQLSALTGTYPISACSAMQKMASTPAMFFSDTTGGTTTCTSTINGSSELLTLFTGIGTSLTSPRLLSNETT
jgi:hypothetical protein